MRVSKKWLSRIVILPSGLLLLVLMAGFLYEQIGRINDLHRRPARIGQAIDIGGRTLNFYCSGEGSPAVIFESGGNDPGYDWSVIQSRVAKYTRACWYDRAGVGWSDPPATPRTSASVVNDLHELLRRASVPPFVLVGASVGGEYARVYTARYPADVAGLVLVDSSQPDQQEPAFMLSSFNLMSPGKRHLICTALPFMARFGVLRFIANRMGRRAPSQSSERLGILARLNSQPMALRVDAEQTCAATDQGRFVPTRGTGNPDLDNAARNAGSLGDRPLIVLTAGRYWAPAGFEKQAAEYHDIWIHQLQASLALLSTQGKQVVVDATHNMDEDPEAVLNSVHEVVNEVRINQLP